MVQVEHVSMSYRLGEVEVPVLRGVDLQVPDGDFLVVVGPSGSGKSTLLNLIGGIDRPTEGRVLVKQVDLGSLTEAELTEYRRSDVGFVFQFYNLIPTLTAVENVAVAAEIASDPLTPEEAIDLVGLADRADHFPAQLSGGEQQRVAIARAIAKRPALLLCDEPTGSLDLHIGRDVLALLERLHTDMSTTVILITHNSAIGAMARRVARIGSGVIENVRVNEQPLSAREVEW